MSTLLGALYDEHADYENSADPDDHSDPSMLASQLSLAVGTFLLAPVTEKIRAVLAFHDPNGLHPSDAEMAAITKILIHGEWI